MFCEQCGQKLPDGTKFCGFCGAKQGDMISQTMTGAMEKPVEVVEAQKPVSVKPVVTPPPVMAPPQQVVAPVQPVLKQQPVQPTPVQQPQQAPPKPSHYQAPPTQGQYAAPQGAGVPPLSVGEFLKMQLLLCIPIVGFVLLLIWSFDSSGNKNKRNYALASLLLMIILMAVGVLLSMLMGGLFFSFLSDMNY